MKGCDIWQYLFIYVKKTNKPHAQENASGRTCVQEIDMGKAKKNTFEKLLP